MRRNRWSLTGVFAAGALMWLPAATAWGFFFDDRREMSLSGFAYSRGTWALANDNISGAKGNWARGNLVQHRNFLTLEWRHNLNRLSRELPTLGTAFQFLNFDALDYYLNMRFEYDSVWELAGKGGDLRKGGTNHNAKYWGQQREAYPGEFARHINFEYNSSRRRIKEALWQLRLFEAYVNITKGPLFIRLGRQNLSWGEADAFRLLDQINPLDNNFGGFTTALDERRIPLDMLRAQWNFGTVGPIQDLTLEGFVSVDQENAARTTLQGHFFTTGSATAPIGINRTPCGDPFFRSRDMRTPEHPNGFPCSLRAAQPHASIEDARGGGRILGTIRDFTFTLAHYYTWTDRLYVRASYISPTPEHLLWDLNGLGNPALLPATNPWGENDPAVGLDDVPGGPGGFLAGTPAAIERNVRSVVNTKRIQITGGSVSFPLNALTSMFVGPESPLFYFYTTIRAEFAYFRDEPIDKHFHDLDAGVGAARFLTPTVVNSGIPVSEIPSASLGFREEFLPNGRFSTEAGSRAGAISTRDFYAWVIGIDHNQWLRFLNPTNSFTFSAQLFWRRGLGVDNTYTPGVPPGLSNDVDGIPVRPRDSAPVGVTDDPEKLNRPGGPGNRSPGCIPGPDGNAPCIYKALLTQARESQVFTLAISTPYLAGNVTPRFVFFYDWAGSWLVQPGIDWTFWDPFRVQLRYNYIDGKYTGIGFLKTRDSIWLELQYLLY